MDNKLRILKQTEMFKALDQTALEHIAELMLERSFEHEDVIIKKMDTDTSMHIIGSGGVNIYYRKGDDEDLLLGHLVAGQHFGEMSLFDDRPRSAMVRSVGPTTTYVIEKKALFTLIDMEKEVGIRILKSVASELSRRLRDTSTALYVSLCIGDNVLGQDDIDRLNVEFNCIKNEESKS